MPNNKSIYSEYQLVQLIKSYTRVSVTTTESGEQRTSNTLIDHFSSSHSKYIIEADVIKTGMVDHYLVYGIRKINAWRSVKSKKQKVIESRNMRKYNKIHFRNDIQQVEWETILIPYCDNTTNMATLIQEIFESILVIHTQLLQITSHLTRAKYRMLYVHPKLVAKIIRWDIYCQGVTWRGMGVLYPTSKDLLGKSVFSIVYQYEEFSYRHAVLNQLF